MRKFELGMVVATPDIAERMGADPSFDRFVKNSLKRFKKGDWGDLCEEDKNTADKAVTDGGMIMGAYKYSGVEIWIVTESDRIVTTVLFPHEW